MNFNIIIPHTTILLQSQEKQETPKLIQEFIDNVSNKQYTDDITSLVNYDDKQKDYKFILIASKGYDFIRFVTSVISMKNIAYLLIFNIIRKFSTFDSEKHTYATLKSIGMFILLTLIFFGFYLYYRYIQNTITSYPYIIQNGLPITEILPIKNPDIKKLLNSRLQLSPIVENEICMKISSFRDNYYKNKNIGVLLMGNQGVGKSEIATLMCQVTNGGYLVHLGSLALMGQQGISIFNQIINECIAERKMLFCDDGDLILCNREKIQFSDNINANYDIEDPKDKYINDTKKILISLMNSFIAYTGSKTLSFIITSNFVYGLNIDDAIRRRVQLFIALDGYNMSGINTLDNQNQNQLQIAKRYVGIYKLKIFGESEEVINRELSISLNHLSGRDMRLFFRFLNMRLNNNSIVHINTIKLAQEMLYPKRENIQQKIQNIYNESDKLYKV